MSRALIAALLLVTDVTVANAQAVGHRVNVNDRARSRGPIKENA